MNHIKYENIHPISDRVIKIIENFSKASGLKASESNILQIPQKFSIPKFIFKKHKVKEFQVDNHSVVVMEHKNCDNNKHIVYFHGGAYVSKGVKQHWMFLSKLMKALNCKATYVDYPLAPEFSYIDTHKMVTQAYDRLVQMYPDDDFILMGDSSGGSLALALTQRLAEEKCIKQPKRLVMFSPWIDLAMENEDIAKLEEMDIMLSKNRLLEDGKSYANGADLNLPLLSPIKGKIEGLCKMELYVGTHEIFYADCMKFNEMALSAGEDITTYVFEKMPHVWVLYPLEEAKIAFSNVVKGIEGM